FTVAVNTKTESLNNKTTIHITTDEGNKYIDFPVQINIPLQNMLINLKTIPVVKGQEVSLEQYTNLITYLPSNTTQKGFTCTPTAISGEEGSYGESDIEVIKDYCSNNPGKLFIDEDLQINSFELEVKSTHKSIIGEYVVAKITVVVIDKMNATAFDILQSNYDEEFPLLETNYKDNGTKEYTLKLVTNIKDNLQYKEADLKLTYNGLDLSNAIYSYIDKNENGDRLDVTSQMFSVYLEGHSWNGKIATIGENGKLQFINAGSISNSNFKDTDLISADKLNSDSFKCYTRNNHQGEYTLRFIIDYFDCEGIYTPTIINVKVITQEKASEIRLFDINTNLNDVDNEDFGFQDGDIVLYNNGDGTFIQVAVWGDNILSGQPMYVTTSSPNVYITRDTTEISVNGEAVELCYSKDKLCIKKTGELEGKVTITFTSSVFESVTRSIVVTYVNNNTVLAFENTNIEVSPEAFAEEGREINRIVNLTAEGYLTASGLPLNELGEIDYSVLDVQLENGSYNSYANVYFDGIDWILEVKNRLGTTKIFATSPNGVRAESKLVIYYYVTNSDFLKIQISNFENYNYDTNYVYQFAGVDSIESDGSNSYTTKLLVDEEYSFYYLLDNHKYLSLDGIMTVNTPTSSDKSCVEVNGLKIKVKKYSVNPVTLTFSFTTTVFPKTIYISVKVEFERIVESITANKYFETVYSLDTLGQSFVTNSNGETYHNLYGKKTINITINPENVTTNPKVTWSAGQRNGTSYIDKDSGRDYLFSLNDGTTINLTYLTKTSVEVTVSNLASTKIQFDFVLFVYVTQKFVTAEGELVEHTLNLPIDIHVKKASSVAEIVPSLFNNRITFDIRDMKLSGGQYVSGNTTEFEYELISNNSNYDLLNKDIIIYTQNADLQIEQKDNLIKVTYVGSTGDYAISPVYKVIIVATSGSKKAIDENFNAFTNTAKYFSTYTTITIRIANGKTIPFEVDSLEELMMIGQDAESMSANYVLTKDINLNGSNWIPLGTREESVENEENELLKKYIPFTGTLSGKYELAEGIYREFGIYNLSINIDSSEVQGNISNWCYGLFGYIGSSGVIKDIKLYNFTVQVKGYISSNTDSLIISEHIGSIAGYNSGSIINCSIADGLIGDYINGASIESFKSSSKGIIYNAGSNSSQ
ncbi:MAG: hypothetical protein ACI4PF_01605, partial [Christensenellales bacterium]